MKIAVVGCGHGELDRIYKDISKREELENIKIDLVLVCGDFQAIRHHRDLSTIACPEKYLRLGTFPDYYNGSKVAPYLTLFIGGNHEASSYLYELYHGGWVAPNIYFVGFAGSLNYCGLKIAGLSGIYKYHDYEKGHFERFPLNESHKRTIYHVRRYNFFRISQLKEQIDIFMNHDWPLGIEKYGDLATLLKKKPFFRREIEQNILGSPPAFEIMEKLVPKYWFSAHMHVKYNAVYCFDPNQIPIRGRQCKFTAFDKCLPGRLYFDVFDFPEYQVTENSKLCYDPEWLAIVKASNEYFSTDLYQRLPKQGEFQDKLQESANWIKENVKNLEIPLNFEMSSDSINPQTSSFCEMLKIENKISI